MPIAGSSASKTVTVASVSVTLETDRSFALPGDRVTMRATVRVDGNPARGVRVAFHFLDSFMYYIADATTDATGAANYIWTVPWDFGGAVLPCTRGYLQAAAEVSDARFWSNKVSFAVAYPTRLSLSTDRDTYAPGSTVTATALLEYNDRGTWKPLANQTVTITAFGASKSVTTGSDGKASTTFTAPTQSGSYTISASYAGTLGYAAAFAGLGIEVSQTTLKVAGLAALALALLFTLKR
jgi:uncharacterized protein YfaS (alpha-2-macroglobulin family)